MKLTFLLGRCYGRSGMNPRRHLRYAVRALRPFVIAVLIAGTGCASGQRKESEGDLATLRSQLEELKKSQDANAREIARLAGEVKALDAQAAFVVAETKSTSDALGRIGATVEQSRTAIGALQSTVDELGRRSPVAPAPAPTMPPSSGADDPPEKIYAAGLASFQAEDYGHAAVEFSELTKRFPDHPLGPSAQYWIGEAHYRQRDYQVALLEFRKVVDVYPKSPQIPEALLKIGLCYHGLQDTARAREVWEQVTKAYPTTSAATEARSLLAGGGTAPAGAER
jgi:tol-pal system protein YbgF